MIEIFENTDVLITVTTDKVITGALEITYVIQDKIGTDVVTKTITGGGVVVTAAQVFEITINKADTAGVIGEFRHQARITDALSKEAIIRFDPRNICILKSII